VSLILADTSVWVAHFRRVNPLLQSLVGMDQVLCHPLIVLELACGTPPAPRERTIGDLRKLRQTVSQQPTRYLP
jgi:predicted nucleic acid-binding protein